MIASNIVTAEVLSFLTMFSSHLQDIDSDIPFHIDLDTVNYQYF